MYAIFESGGFQFKAKEGDRVRMPKLQAGPEERVTFDKVLFIGGKKPLVGSPYLENAKVEGEVIASGKSEKVTVFKFKRRVKYRRKKGHRQEFVEVQIEKIVPPR
ncbi:MAG: 50S ribosomal protein L21 [Candidatus Zixiibacteriota bacterium]|nr:MAG: 50S ribosomal protein L21 [candidate division Zixibacteria bacterium]